MSRNAERTVAGKRPLFFSFLLVLFSSLLTILFADRVILGLWLKHPARPPLPISHPAHFSRQRENIEFAYSMRTNGHGIRYREMPLEKKKQEFRFLVLGDSYTEGVGVEMNSRFTERLETKLSGEEQIVSFVNAGFEGASPLDYARFFVRKGRDFKPDALLIVYFANDLGDIKVPLAPKEIETGEGWLYPKRMPSLRGMKRLFYNFTPHLYVLLEQAFPPPPQRDWMKNSIRHAGKRGIPRKRIESWENSLPPELARAAGEGRFTAYILTRDLFSPQFWTESLDLSTPQSEGKWKTVSAVFDVILQIAKKQKIAAGLIFAPTPLQYDPDYGNLSKRLGGTVRTEWLEEETEIEKRLKAWARARQMPYLSLTPSLRAAYKQGIRVHYPLDGHWTVEGNEIVANEIRGWLESKETAEKLFRKTP